MFGVFFLKIITLEFLKYRVSQHTCHHFPLVYRPLSLKGCHWSSLSFLFPTSWSLLSRVSLWISRVVRNYFLFGPMFILLAFSQNYAEILSISLWTWQISIMLSGESPVSSNSSIPKGAYILLPPSKHARYFIFLLFLPDIAYSRVTYIK